MGTGEKSLQLPVAWCANIHFENSWVAGYRLCGVVPRRSPHRDGTFRHAAFVQADSTIPGGSTSSPPVRQTRHL